MAETAGNIFFFEWEMRLMEQLQARLPASGFFFQVLSWLSGFGEQLFLVAVMGFLYWGLNKDLGKYVGVNVLAANVWNSGIKNAVLRLRPYFVPGRDVKILRLVDGSADPMDVAAQGYSFPSGHCANAAACYGSLAVHERKRKVLRVLALVLPVLVGFSRVFVGAHYPTDVLAGWLLGLVVITLVPWLRRKTKKRPLFYAALFLISVPGFFWCASNDYFTSLGMLLGFMIAEPFEERFVRFENTRNVLRCLLRTAAGGLLYFGLDIVLKLPFPKELLESGGFAAHLIRTSRYAVIIFVDIGVYPMLFRVTGKLWKRTGRTAG